MIEELSGQFALELDNTSLLAFVLVFAGGILTSLSPCVLSMLPILVGYIGISESTKKQDALIQSVLFVMGLAFVVAVLGIIAATFGGVIGSHLGKTWYLIMSVIAILCGLAIMELFYIPFPTIVTKFPSTNRGKYMTPFIVGIAFGLANSPCATPFLAGILAYIAYKGNIYTGALLLVLYSLGQGVILVAAGVFVGFLKNIKSVAQYSGIIKRLSGSLLVLTGLYIAYIAFF